MSPAISFHRVVSVEVKPQKWGFTIRLTDADGDWHSVDVFPPSGWRLSAHDQKIEAEEVDDA